MERKDDYGVLTPLMKWVLALLLIFSLFYRLGSWGVIDTSEARYAEIARQMFESGDYLHPRYLGIEHYHKPPMTYWITASAYHIFGVSPFASRFFLQCAFLLQIILVYLIARSLDSRPATARNAALIYSSFMMVWISVRNLTTDAYLNTFLLLSTWSLLSYLLRSKTKYLYFFAFFVALAFLTKITAVFVFMGSLVLFLFWEYWPKIKWSWHFLGAAVLTFVLSVSWFYLLQIEGKPVLKYMLYEQSVVRYASDTFRRSMPWYFYLVAGTLLTFPWFFLVITRLMKKNAGSQKNFLLKLFGLCLMLPITFFSISHSKLLLYVLPAFWTLAIISGKMLNNLPENQIRNWLRIESIWIILILSALLILPFIDSHYILSSGLLTILVIGSFLFIFIYLTKSLTSSSKLTLLPFGLSLCLVMMSTHFLASNEESSSTGKIAAQWIMDEGLNERPIYIYDKLAPSFAFHLKKEIILIGRSEKRELRFESTDYWKNYYYDLDISDRKNDLLQALGKKSLLIVRTKRLPQVDSDLTNYFSSQYESGLWTILY